IGSVVGGVGYSQGWFSSTKKDALVKDGKSKAGEDGKVKLADGKGDAPANGVVAAIPKNYIDTLKNKFDPNPTMLQDVEKKLNGRGKKLAPDQVPPLVTDLMRLGQVAPTAACYQWSSKTGSIYLVFDGNTYTGVANFKGR